MHKTTSYDAYPELVKVTHAAEITSLSVNTVRKYADECGASLKIGRAYRIRIRKLIDYLCTFERETK